MKARLKIASCAAAAVLAAGGAAAQDNVETIGQWRLTSVVDPITDEGRMIATLESEGSMLAVKCDSPGPDSVYIHWIASDYLGGRGTRFDTRPLTYRFDQAEPITEAWSYDGRSAIQTGDRQARAFAFFLQSAERIVLRGSDFRGSQKTAVFTATPSDTQQALARVFATCGSAPLPPPG